MNDIKETNSTLPFCKHQPNAQCIFTVKCWIISKISFMVWPKYSHMCNSRLQSLLKNIKPVTFHSRNGSFFLTNEDRTRHSELISSTIATTKSLRTAILAVAIIHVQLQ